jgi:hypothetical protein
MDEEIASAMNTALFQQQAQAHAWIMNMRRNAKCTIAAMMLPNATTEMALLCQDIIINASGWVDKGIIDVEGNKCRKRRKIHTVPLVRYMGKGSAGRQTIREEIQAENKGVAIPAQAR